MANRSSGIESKNSETDARLRAAGELTESLLVSGKITGSAAQKIFESLGYTPNQKTLTEQAMHQADFLSWAATGLGSLIAAVGMSMKGVWVRHKPESQHASESSKQSSDRNDVTRPHVGGIDSLLSLESLTETLKPLFNEYVWWFIAMVLVISGSIMGIREAWLRFEGILRPFMILFAFFVYHVLFLGLGLFIHRKSTGTGKMLMLIAGALIPLMFFISANILRVSPEAGAAATAIALLLTFITLLPLTRRVQVPYASALLCVPIPFALGALAGLAPVMPILLPTLIVAIGAATMSAVGLIDTKKEIMALVFAVLALSILVFALFTLPIAVTDDLSGALRLTVLVMALGQFSLLQRSFDRLHGRFFAALEIVAYAMLALIAFVAAAAFAGQAGSTLPFTFHMLVIVPAIAIFLRAARYHNAAIHAVIFLCMVFCLRLTRIVTPEYAWQVFAFFIFPLALPWFSRNFHPEKKKIFLYWAVVSGICASVVQLFSAQPHIAAAFTGLLTAVTIHRAAGFSRSPWHYLSPIGVLTFVARLPLPAEIILQPNEVFLAMAVLYAIGGFFFERHAAPPDETSPGSPIDDLSLCFGALALLVFTAPVVASETWTVQYADRNIALRPVVWLAFAWLFMTLRTLRDRSAVISAYAGLAVTFGLYNILAPPDFAQAALFCTVMAVFFYLIAATLRSAVTVPAASFGRVFLMRLRLPFNQGGLNNIAVGSAFVTLVLLAAALLSAANWISMPDFSFRLPLLVAMVACMVIAGAVFHYRVFAIFRLRGSLVMLYVLLGAIALTAIINRLGRPLPVDVVTLRLLLLFPLIALVAFTVQVYGPRYAAYLQAESQGRWYFLVPATGVAGLTLLLAYEVFAVSLFDFDRAFAFVPPTAYLALALYPLILVHTVHVGLRHLFYLFLPIFVAALFASQSFTGPALYYSAEAAAWLPRTFAGNASDLLMNFSLALKPGLSYLQFRQNIVMGIAAGALALAVLAVISRRHNALQLFTKGLFTQNNTGVSKESGLWSLGFTALIGLMSLQVATIEPGAILFFVAILYLWAQNVRASALIMFTGGLLIVHGGAHMSAVYPLWPGPALALAAIVMLLPAKSVAKRLDLSENFVSDTAFLAGSLYLLAGFFYAATEGQVANALAAGTSILIANASYLARDDYFRSAGLVVTLLLASGYFRLALALKRGPSRSTLAWLSAVFFSAAITTASWLILSRLGYNFNFLQASPYALSGVLVYLIILTFFAGRLQSADTERHAGYVTALDTLVISCGVVLAAMSRELTNPLPGAAFASLAVLIMYLLLNIIAALKTQRTRYVYIAQMTIAGIYYSARPILRIDNAQTDAFFVLGYAFALVGVSVFANRFSLKVVSEPTRRFAAALPLVAALVVDNFRSLNTALLSVISSGLYFTLSRLGERHLFAALAAITLNAALFFVALAAGYDSSEFYAFPAGLTVIFFATIFKGSLSLENQARVRTIGGLIAYLPAALQVTMRSGLAQNPVYSLAFGAVCLVGMLVGTLLHVRSYLFLGVLFFTLDVVANLVQEGLQNQFVGFMLLTFTGLALIMILIVYNLKNEQVKEIYRRLSAKFARWQ